MLVLKKDGLTEEYDFSKIRVAVEKSARRACVDLDDDDFIGLESHFRRKLKGVDEISVVKLHDYVESILCKRFPEVGKSYKEYRDFKKTAVEALDDLYTQSKNTLFLGDRENANFNSSLTSTKGALMGGYLRKQIYKDYYLTKEEREATKDGYIYIHDLSMLFLGCQNCSLFDMGNVLRGGFKMADIGYTEPKTFLSACQVIGDITLSATAGQYGGQQM